MAELKIFLKIVNWMFISMWGLNVIDLTKQLDVNFYSSVDNWIKLLMAIAGLIYFLISIPHKMKKQKLDREKLRKEIEALDIENKNGKHNE